MHHYFPSQREHHLRIGKRRRGITLVELLVVVAMLMILISVLTAAMQPVLSGQELREAARGLNAYIAGCVARAAERGRPVGIWIQRSSGGFNSAFDIFYAEVPPLYAGDALSSNVQFNGATSVSVNGASQMAVAGFVQPNDRIRFNYSGPWYRITAVTPGSPPSITFSTADKPGVPYFVGQQVPFQIERGPRKSVVQPMQLPNNTVIDLSKSGVGTDARFASTVADPVIVMFNPDASVERVYYHNGTNAVAQPILNSIHFLIGRPDQVDQSPGNAGAEPNENLWISINHQTGRVISTENMGGALDNARRYAIDGSGMGGG